MLKNPLSTAYKQPDLFNTTELIQRPIPEQREFELAYFKLLKALPAIIDEAFEVTHKAKRRKAPLSIGRNWFPNEMNGNVLNLVAQSFPDFVRYTGRGSHCLYLNYKYECYIKKLSSKKLFPTYNHSKTSKRLCDQTALPSQEPVPIIYMGWTISKTNEQIKGYFAVCRKGDERIWHSDLTAIRLNENIVATEIQEVENPHEVLVKVKKNRKAK